MTTTESVSKHAKFTVYFLGFISFVLFVYILSALKEILIPVTISIFLTYLFHPLVMFLKKYGIPKWVSIILILLTVSVIYYFTTLLLISNFRDFFVKLETYSANINKILSGVLKPFNITLWEFGKMIKIPITHLNQENFFKYLYEAGVVEGIFDSLMRILGDIFISLFFWVFMIIGKNKFENRVKNAYNGKHEMIQANIDSFDTQLQSYIVLKTILSLIMGLSAAIIFIFYGIDFALFWGLLTFVLNYIPNIGAFIATDAPLLMSMLQYGFGFRTISLALIILIVHNIIGNILEPHFMGRQMDLSPVFVLFSLIFWGLIWGIAGMFLAVPIAAAMKILFSNIEALKPLSIIMGTKGHSLVLPSPENGASNTIVIK